MCYENMITLQWRHNGRDGVSNHQPHDCLLNRLFGHRSQKTSKLRVTGLCDGNSSVTGEFPTQRASNAENVSIWWRHHEEEPLPVRGTFECEVKVGSKILMPSSVSLRGVVYLYLGDTMSLQWMWYGSSMTSQIARLTWQTWGPPGSCRPQVGPMFAPWILLSVASFTNMD